MQPAVWKRNGTATLVAQGTVLSIKGHGATFTITLSDLAGVKRTIEIGEGAPVVWLEVVQFSDLRMETVR